MVIVYGTGSFNRSNIVAQYRECDKCQQETDQHSFDALQCFTLYWIPIIPYGKKHFSLVCDECGSGRVMSTSRWNRQKKRAVDKAFQEWERNPDSRDAALDVLVDTYSHEDIAVLDELCEDLRARFPDDDEIQRKVNWVEGAFEAAKGRPRPGRKFWPLLVAPVLLGMIAAPIIARAIEGTVESAYIVNGLERGYSVLVNDERYDLAPEEVREIKIAFGPIHMRPVDGGLPIPEYVGELNAAGSVAFNDSAVILNPDRTAAFWLETAVYAKNEADRRGGSGGYAVHIGQAIYHFQDIDYFWRDAPLEIDISSSTRVERRRAINRDDDESLGERLSLAAEYMAPEAFRVHTAQVFALAPDDTNVIQWLINWNPGGEVLDLLETQLDERPVLVNCHRMFQTVSKVEDPNRDLHEMYGDFLQAEPDNHALMYLYARTFEETDEQGDKLFRQSTEKPDPCAYGHYGLSWRALLAGDFEAALVEARSARNLDAAEPSFEARVEQCLLATNNYEQLLKNLTRESTDFPEYTRTRKQVLLLARLDRMKEAEQVVDEYVELLQKSGSDDGQVHLWMANLDLAIAEGAQDFTLYVNACNELDQPGADYQRCLVEGNVQEAITHLAHEDVSDMTADHLVLFALASAAGERAIAEQQMIIAKERLADEGPPDLLALFAGETAPSLTDAVQVSMHANKSFATLAALAYHYPDQEEEFLAAAGQYDFMDCLEQLLHKRLTLLNAAR